MGIHQELPSDEFLDRDGQRFELVLARARNPDLFLEHAARAVGQIIGPAPRLLAHQEQLSLFRLGGFDAQKMRSQSLFYFAHPGELQVEALFPGFGVVDRHLVADLFVTLEQLLDGANGFHDVAEHVLGLVERRLLQQDPDAVARLSTVDDHELQVPVCLHRDRP